MSRLRQLGAHALVVALVALACSGRVLRTSDPADDPVSPGRPAQAGRTEAAPSAAPAGDPAEDSAAPQDAHRAPPATTASSSADAPEPEPSSAPTTNRDAELVRELERAIARMPSLSLAARSVNVTCRDGKLVLSGTVQSLAERNAIERAAQQLDGVRHIDSRLTVEQ